MAGALMTAEQYQQHGLSAISPLNGRPTPTNVTDGRFFGDEVWNVSVLGAASADQAAKLSAVYYCVSVIAEAVGSLPFMVLDSAGHPIADPLGEVLSDAPNPLQTGAEFWASMAFRAALAGHAFAEPVATDDGLAIWALSPDRHRVDWHERSFTVHYTGEDNVYRRLGPGEVFWFSGVADSKLMPLTPWKMAKGSIDFALALESQGRNFFQNFARVAGVLSTEQKIGKESRDEIEAAIKLWRSGQTPVLPLGLKYQSVGAANAEAQLYELIRQRTLEMARYWRIPRSMVGEDAGTAASQEQQALEFVKYTIRPWTRRIEQAIRQRLMTPDHRARLKVKLNLDGLLRGDSATQWKNAVLARTASVLSVNDLRVGWFDQPKINEPWADDPRTPLNSNHAGEMITGGQTAPQDRTETDDA